MRLLIYACLISFGLLPLSGCGGSDTAANANMPDMGSEDGLKIAQLVEKVNDEKSTAASLTKLFAKGATPKDLKKYPRYYYEVSGKPTVSGDTSSAKIKLKDEQKGNDAPEQEWTFVKEGSDWKIKTAPLP